MAFVSLSKRRILAGAAICVAWSSSSITLAAQEVEKPAKGDEIVVTGKRLPGSVIGDVDPVGILDADAIKATGATSIEALLKLIKPLTTSSGGLNPVFLLNGRRVAPSEIYTLPSEAMERTEILPEQEATRFGFPPNVRVVNFITKKHFRAAEVTEAVGTTTEGGGGSVSLALGSTRIDESRRTSVNVNYDRQNSISGTRRLVTPDSSNLFDLTGNVSGVGGATLSPALDALAGRAIGTAAVPGDPFGRAVLANYAAGVARVTDLSPYGASEGSDALKVDASRAFPIGKAIQASVNLAMQAQRRSSIAGLPAVTLRLPASNPFVPFGNDVLLYRYVPEAGSLRPHSDSLNLHAGAVLNGTVASWQWSATAGYDRARSLTSSDQGISTTAFQAAIDAGGDPFRTLSPAETAGRLITNNRTVARTSVGNATASGPVVKLPAGPAMMTLTADYTRTSADREQNDAATASPALRRTARSATVAVSLPITSKERGVLGAVGTLSANGQVGLSSVTAYRNIVSSNVGLTWSPASAIEFNASITRSQAAPSIAQLTDPAAILSNFSVFDFVTGTSSLVRLVTGGNPDLAPERRRVTTAGVSLHPIRDKEFRIFVNYIETRTDDQYAAPGGVTPALQAAFPTRYVRDGAGRLTSVDLRTINLGGERERKLEGRLSLWTPIGPAPKPPVKQTGAASDAPPPPPPKRRPTLYSFVFGTMRLDDTLVLAPGQPTLDLLDGQSINGNGGRPRFEANATLGGSIGPVRTGFFGNWAAPTRMRSDLASADLRFSARTSLYFYTVLDAAELAPKTGWAKGLTIEANVENLLDTRPVVTDRNGVTPYRYQRNLIDFAGRAVKVSVRKIF